MKNINYNNDNINSIDNNIKITSKDDKESIEDLDKLYYIDDLRYKLSKDETENIIIEKLKLSDEITSCLENNEEESLITNNFYDKQFYDNVVFYWDKINPQNSSASSSSSSSTSAYSSSSSSSSQSIPFGIASRMKIQTSSNFICRICEIRGYSSKQLLINHYRKYHKIINIEILIKEERFFNCENDWWIANRLNFDVNQSFELYKFKTLKYYLNHPVSILNFPSLSIKLLQNSNFKEAINIIQNEIELKKFSVPNYLKNSMRNNAIDNSKYKDAGKDFKSHILKFLNFLLIIEEEKTSLSSSSSSSSSSANSNNNKKSNNINNNSATNKGNTNNNIAMKEVKLCMEQVFDPDRIKFYILFQWERKYSINSIYNSMREIHRFFKLLKPEAKERFPHSKVSSVKLFLKTTLNALNKAKKFHQREMKSSITSSQPSSQSSLSFVNENELNNKINETLSEGEMKMFFSSILEQLLIIKYFLEKNYNNNNKNNINTNYINNNNNNNNNNEDNKNNNSNNNNIDEKESDLFEEEEDEIVIDDNGDVNDDDDFLPDKRIKKNILHSSKLQSNKREEIKMIGKSHIYFLHPEEFRNQQDLKQSNKSNYKSFLPPLTNINEFILLSSYQNYLIALTLLLMLGQRPSFILNSTFENTMVKEGRLAFAPRVEKTLRSEYHPIVSSSPFFLIEEKDYFTKWVNNYRKLFIRVSLKVNPHLINNNYAIKRSNNTPSSLLLSSSSSSSSVYDSVIQIWVNHAGNAMSPKQFRSAFRNVAQGIFPQKTRITPMTIRHLIPTFFANNVKLNSSSEEYERIEKNLSIHLNTSVSILKLYYSDVNHSGELHQTVDMLSETFLLDEKSKMLLEKSLSTIDNDNHDELSAVHIHPSNSIPVPSNNNNLKRKRDDLNEEKEEEEVIDDKLIELFDIDEFLLSDSFINEKNDKID